MKLFHRLAIFIALFGLASPAMATCPLLAAPMSGSPALGYSTTAFAGAPGLIPLSVDGSCDLNVKSAPYQYTPLPSGQFGLALTTATSLTVPSGATYALITVEGAAVRWRDDGTAPTATIGQILEPGASMNYSGPLSAIQFIAASAGATLDVSYYK